MHDRCMRTTIEIDDETLKKLRDLASERGERGYSRLINEALERYLTAAGFESEGDRRRKLAALYGAWDDATADAVRARIADSRKQWR